MGRRYLAALMLVLALAVAVPQLMDIVVPDICRALDPNNWTDWLIGLLHGCWKDSAGGGGGGAG